MKKFMMKKEKRKNCFKNSGFIFLEILISVALVSIVFITLMGVGFLSLNISSSIKKTTQINFLIAEELEAVRSFRDATLWATNGLGTVNTGAINPYHFVLDTVPNPPKWILVSGTETIGDFTRSVVFDKVYRDSSDNIVAFGKGGELYNSFIAFALVCGDEGGPGCIYDPDTKKVTVRVVFNGRTYRVITYLTNWQNK